MINKIFITSFNGKTNYNSNNDNNDTLSTLILISNDLWFSELDQGIKLYASTAQCLISNHTVPLYLDPSYEPWPYNF